MLDVILQSVASIIEPKVFLAMSIGVLAGLFGGAIPGITLTMTVILVLPFTYGMDPLQGIATMIGVYVGGESGGLVSASLLGIPGTPSAIATTFDGYPMAKKGEPGRAVWTGIWASLIGGLLAGILLVIGATQLARLALSFGPWEYFSLFVLTLSIVGALTEGSIIKGLLSGAVGLLITTIGPDPLMSIPRFTFGSLFFKPVLPSCLFSSDSLPFLSSCRILRHGAREWTFKTPRILTFQSLISEC
jgi:putative tricarboxylic transport membrane protein